MDLTATEYRKLGHRRRINNNIRNKKHLKCLWDAKNHKWFPPVKYVDYVWFNHSQISRNKPYYKVLTPNHGGNWQRFCKKYSNRMVRHYVGEISKGCSYKKLSEYKWVIH